MHGFPQEPLRCEVPRPLESASVRGTGHAMETSHSHPMQKTPLSAGGNATPQRTPRRDRAQRLGKGARRQTGRPRKPLAIKSRWRKQRDGSNALEPVLRRSPCAIAHAVPKNRSYESRCRLGNICHQERVTEAKRKTTPSTPFSRHCHALQNTQTIPCIEGSNEVSSFPFVEQASWRWLQKSIGQTHV